MKKNNDRSTSSGHSNQPSQPPKTPQPGVKRQYNESLPPLVQRSVERSTAIEIKKPPGTN
ncbi:MULTISPECIES: hypothetical protein [unclassified Paenibacillus]|uniref:hypothetical protein n=1 Tax=unclassified Paenibacillus TaxID=185978 RepID=UPI0024058D80|nr:MULTISPECIES: hypothetical protein [unclassified Paenibacillus]MDF9841945.1 hypothetical protein [Paenibacillus sp. PastF-2]MDF9848374.1 hypothetical protein [Paenibacillus sp. PastM-2]MDF9855105.1 hypothetical protein [Paenibacillus sp. PastF-1]MDH6480374.1 hypothetical protein [Paenibacillus sp. PastH-2]MDH6507642.1 hypothetical protein [Paenibacillus sp. PastM-3]